MVENVLQIRTRGNGPVKIASISFDLEAHHLLFLWICQTVKHQRKGLNHGPHGA